MASDLNIAYRAYRHDPCDDTLNTLLSAARTRIKRVTGRCDNLDREDLTQTILLTIWQSLDRYNGSSELATWMHGIARRKINDAYRQLYATPRMQPMQVDEIDEEYRPHPAPPAIDLDAILPADLTMREHELVEALTTYHLQADAAAELGISHSALRSRKKRLRRKILRHRDTLDPSFND
jgi:RNA polymerase sigma factor (sigma-70 family)